MAITSSADGYQSIIGRELLDDPAADPGTVRESLRHLARSNRWFGGLPAARAGVRRLLWRIPGPAISLLDVGTGAGDVPAALRLWLARKGFRVTTFGVDRHRAAAPLAAGKGVPTAVADAFALPFGTASIDLVLVSQLAHHFSPDGVLALARECSRVAGVGVVIADLRRSRLAQVGFELGARLLRFDRVTRVDGITSLARGFDRAGLANLLASAGFRPAVSTHPGARIVATWSVAR